MPALRPAALALATLVAAAPHLSAQKAPEMVARTVIIKNDSDSPCFIKAMRYATPGNANALIGPNGNNAPEPAAGWKVEPHTKVQMAFRAHYWERKDWGIYGFRILDQNNYSVEYIMVNNPNKSDCDWFQFGNMENVQDFDYSTVSYRRDNPGGRESVHTFTINRKSFKKTFK